MAEIIRLVENMYGTFGVFIYENTVICNTLELPWKNNLQNISCIPKGVYRVYRRDDGRFFVSGVPARSAILIHPGNTLHDSRGCILPGAQVVYDGLVGSAAAMRRLRNVLPSDFILKIDSIIERKEYD